MNNYKYYCAKCNYGTDIRYSLIQHNETDLHKTGERGKKPIKEKEIFSCGKCDFTSTNKNNYLTHKLNNHSTKEERKKNLNIIVILAMLVYFLKHHLIITKKQ